VQRLPRLQRLPMWRGLRGLLRVLGSVPLVLTRTDFPFH